MKFAIIAAGEGSRLAQEGIEQPKPLVEVAGEKLIDRLIRIFQQNGAEEIVIIVNTLTNKVEKHLNTLQTKVPLRIVSKTTPSSMHSFAEIAPYLGDAPFCLTTVDTIFDEQEFTDYINHFQESKIDGLMAVTDYIDDEKPLYVTTNEKCGVTGFFD